jgi:NitT/TauT family transport system permease protein
MTKAGWIRLAIVVAFFGALEVMCRVGWIGRLTMIPPSEMAEALWSMLLAGSVTEDVLFTLRNTVAAVALSVVAGFVAGVIIHAIPRLRRILDPLFASYYAVPVFVFYPLLLVIFGINATPLIVIGAMFGIVAMLISTLTGLDRVPRVMFKSARMFRLDPVRAALLIKLPSAAPHLITGVKLAVVYSVIAVVAGEFILSSKGIGHRIAFAYNDFDSRTMYGLLLLLLTVVTIVTMSLHMWEHRLHRRWARQ